MEMYYGVVVAMFLEMDMTDLDVDEVIIFANILKEDGYVEAYEAVKIRKMFYDLHRSKEA